MKTKDGILNMSKGWFPEIAVIQAKCPLLMIVSDNRWENTSKDLNEFYSDNRVKKHFSTPYEQWRNGLTEASVGLVSMLGKTRVAESGLGGPYWFCAAHNGVN